MELVETIEGIRENIAYFEEHLTSGSDYEKEFVMDRLSQGKNYIAYHIGKEVHFVPSRFVGYKRNTVRKHDKGNVDGRETSQRLRRAKLLGVDVPNEILEQQLREQCERLGLTLSNREHTFWTMPGDMKPSVDKVIRDAEEGRKILTKHTTYERNSKLSRSAKDRYLEEYGSVCQACGFDFEKRYGALGADYIEAHHSKPLNERSHSERTTIDDFNFLCSNCHSMIHRDIHHSLTLEELQAIIKTQKSKK